MACWLEPILVEEIYKCLPTKGNVSWFLLGSHGLDLGDQQVRRAPPWCKKKKCWTWIALPKKAAQCPAKTTCPGRAGRPPGSLLLDTILCFISYPAPMPSGHLMLGSFNSKAPVSRILSTVREQTYYSPIHCPWHWKLTVTTSFESHY